MREKLFPRVIQGTLRGFSMKYLVHFIPCGQGLYKNLKGRVGSRIDAPDWLSLRCQGYFICTQKDVRCCPYMTDCHGLLIGVSWSYVPGQLLNHPHRKHLIGTGFLLQRLSLLLPWWEYLTKYSNSSNLVRKGYTCLSFIFFFTATM